MRIYTKYIAVIIFVALALFGIAIVSFGAVKANAYETSFGSPAPSALLQKPGLDTGKPLSQTACLSDQNNDTNEESLSTPKTINCQINPSTGKIVCLSTITVTNKSSTSAMYIESVSLVHKQGYESITGTWILKYQDIVLYNGEMGQSMPVSSKLRIEPNSSITLSLECQRDGWVSHKNINSAFAEFVYDYKIAPVEQYVNTAQSDTKYVATFYNDNKKFDRDGDVYKIFDDDSIKQWNVDHIYDITDMIVDASFSNIKPTHCAYWFGIEPTYTVLTVLKHIDVSNLNTSDCISMKNMFAGAYKIESIDGLENFDTSKVQNFERCFDFVFNKKMPGSEIANWDTSSATNMARMFARSNSDVMPSIQNLNVSNVVTMKEMFYHCYFESYLSFEKWDTSNLEDISYMFANNDWANYAPDLTNFNTSKLKNAEYAFLYFGNENNGNSYTIDIHTWDLSSLQNSASMFEECRKLTDIYCNVSLNNSSVLTNSTNMFKGCQTLIYQKRIKVYDKTYAYPATAKDTKGMFTSK